MTPISKTNTQLSTLETILENDNFSENVKNKESVSEISTEIVKWR